MTFILDQSLICLFELTWIYLVFISSGILNPDKMASLEMVILRDNSPTGINRHFTKPTTKRCLSVVLVSAAVNNTCS